MLRLVRWLARLCELILTCPYGASRFVFRQDEERRPSLHTPEAKAANGRPPTDA